MTEELSFVEGKIPKLIREDYDNENKDIYIHFPVPGTEPPPERPKECKQEFVDCFYSEEERPTCNIYNARELQA